jgi:lipopolysaccharide transport system permease protein
MLGAAWTVLSPLAMILVYTLIFSQVMHNRLPGATSEYGYSIYLCAGMLTWGLFAEITGRGQNMFIEQANLLKKISFPRICLPIIVVLNALVNFGIIFGLFTVFLIGQRPVPRLALLRCCCRCCCCKCCWPSAWAWCWACSMYSSATSASSSRSLQFWFWLTPIVYPASILPAVRPCWPGTRWRP